MSFAGKVKEELLEILGKSKHCQLAELAAIFSVCGQVIMEEKGNFVIQFHTENLTVARKCFILIKKAFRIIPDVSLRGHHQYGIYILAEEDATMILKALQILEGALLVPEGIIAKQCCKRAFLRGLFLACGSVSDPNSGYHLELVAGNQNRAVRIQEIIGVFGLEAKMIERKNSYTVYLKDGAGIVDFLNIIGAHVALMEFENVRILKELRNSVNRQVNCETANIKKTVSAASRQVEDIRYIKEVTGFGNLSSSLAEIAEKRLENPEMSLKDLGGLLEPPIGKSGVNHRLRKLSELAEKLRQQKNQK